MTLSYRAAWVPDDDPQRDWEVAAALVVDWALEQAAALSVEPLLITNSFGVEGSVPSLQRLLRYADHVTPRSRRAVRPGNLAVVAYVPYDATLALAVQMAHGGALGVVETVAFPISGWARETGAVNLTTGTPAAPFSADIAKQLDRVIFHGNNGWTRGFGADQTLRILTDLRRAGFDDLAGVTGFVGALGKSGKSMARLRALALKAGFSEPEEPDYMS
jgi:hypothetical protein